MPIRFNQNDFDRVENKLLGMFANMREDFEFVGERMAEAIVQTTLAGIGEGDEPFAVYSESYIERLNAAGGKPRGVVDLRGIFFDTPGKVKRGKRFLKSGKRADIRITFAASGGKGSHFVPVKLVSFDAKTPVVRPMRGMRDEFSEMSIDLISTKVKNDRSFTLEYTPRERDYMIRHNKGDVRGGKVRRWFTLGKQAVVFQAVESMRIVLHARALWFNDHANASPEPPHQPRKDRPT